MWTKFVRLVAKYEGHNHPEMLWERLAHKCTLYEHSYSAHIQQLKYYSDLKYTQCKVIFIYSENVLQIVVTPKIEDVLI